MRWHDGEMLAFDLETTGVDRRDDVPVSFALLRSVSGSIVERHVGLIDPGREIPAEATAIHGITTEQARCGGRPLADALELIAAVVLEAAARNVPVVGMNVGFDLSILHHQLRRHSGLGLVERGWCGPLLDVLVLDRHYDRYRPGKRRLELLCAHYCVDTGQSHDAGADAAAALAVLFALCRCYPDLRDFELETLSARQARWHRQWAETYDSWRARNSLELLDPSEYDWPLAGHELFVAEQEQLAALAV